MTNLRNRTLTILLIVLAFRLNAQDSHQNAEVFPFSEPEQAGVSSYKLNLLKDEINSWIKSGELMGGEVLIIKDEHKIVPTCAYMFIKGDKTSLGKLSEVTLARE